MNDSFALTFKQNTLDLPSTWSEDSLKGCKYLAHNENEVVRGI